MGKLFLLLLLLLGILVASVELEGVVSSQLAVVLHPAAIVLFSC